MARDREEPPDREQAAAPNEGFDTVARALMAGVATLISVAATFGAVTGGVAFLLRNRGAYMGAALVLAALAAAIAAGVVVWPRRPDRAWAIRATAFLLSGALLGAALILVFAVQVKLASAGSRPVIQAEWTSQGPVPTLTISARADGLAINDRLYANVLAYPRGQKSFLTYYSGFTGPDVEGHSEQKVAVPVPLTQTELVGGAPTTSFIGSVMVAAIVEKQNQAPLIAPSSAVGVTCQGEVFATENGRRVSPSGEPVARTTKPACIFLQAVSPPGPADAMPTGGKYSLDVAGTKVWTDSRLYVTQGQQLVIRASGQVGFVQGGPLVGPSGATDLHPGVGVLPGPNHHAALIGRITGAPEGAPFLIGDNLSVKTSQSGLLLLGVNDVGVDNNSGQFHVDIEVGAA